MVDPDAPLAQQLFQIPIREAVAGIPADRQRDHLGREPEAGEHGPANLRTDGSKSAHRPSILSTHRPPPRVRPRQQSPLALVASYNLCHTMAVADTITFRPDEDAAQALAVLTRDGTSVSTAVRAALIDAARNRAKSTLRAEAEALAADDQDRAEAAQVLRDMETLRAW